MCDKPSKRITFFGPADRTSSMRDNMRSWSKWPSRKISVLPSFHNQLPSAAQTHRYRFPHLATAGMVIDQSRIHDVKGLFATFDTFSDKRGEDPVLFLRRVKESANVALGSERRVCKVDRLFPLGIQPPIFVYAPDISEQLSSA